MDTIKKNQDRTRPKYPVRLLTRYGRPKLRLPSDALRNYIFQVNGTATLLVDDAGTWYLDPAPPDHRDLATRHKDRLPIVAHPCDVRQIGNSIYAIPVRPMSPAHRWAKGAIVVLVPHDRYCLRLDWPYEDRDRAMTEDIERWIY